MPTTTRPLRLTTAEWQVICTAMGLVLRPPGPHAGATAAARTAARDSLSRRNVTTDGGARIARPVAALMFSLAHPVVSAWAHPHGNPVPSAVLAFNRLVSAIAWQDGNDILVAPTSRASAARDLAAVLLPGAGPTTRTHDTAFGVAGGLWHEMLTQAPVASERALSSLAASEGVAADRVPDLVAIARGAASRVDVRVARPSSSRTWAGHETSLIPSVDRVWSVSDGRAFDPESSRRTKRATFVQVDPAAEIGRLLFP